MKIFTLKGQTSYLTTSPTAKVVAMHVTKSYAEEEV